MEAAQLRGDMMVTPPGNAPLFPTNFLNAGAKIGLVGGSDHARSRPAGICLTGLWVKELTASAVLDALKQRRTVTTIGGKLPLWVECEGGAMGASGNATLPVDFRLSLPPDAPLRSLRMMRSGEWLEPVIVRDDSGTKTLRDEHAVPGNHFYVFRIESDFGPHRETITAYTSPIWLTV
jgi:hypothetical protein